jgi:LysR family hydrogen peroxide-inducible transcriptional activator
MEFHQLKYFVAVARTGSFVRAAEEEGITQPSLSQQIRKLEGALGAPLFDRLGRTIRLTRFGEALLPEAEEILKRANFARRTLEALQTEDSGALKVGVIPTVLPYSFAAAVSEFHEKHPKVEIQVRELTTDRLIPLVGRTRPCRARASGAAPRNRLQRTLSRTSRGRATRRASHVCARVAGDPGSAK